MSNHRSKYPPLIRPTPCMHRCVKPNAPSTMFQRFHPFKPGWEIRVCPGCGRSSAYSCTVVG